MTIRNDRSGIQQNPDKKKNGDPRDYYLRLFDDFPNPIWRAGLDAKFDYFNRAWLAYTGRTLEQEQGEGWAQGVHPEDRDRCVTQYRDAFIRRQPFSMEYRLRHHNGSYRWIFDSGKPFYDPSGAFAGFIGSCYDIDDRKRAEIALAESEKQYRELVENLSEVIVSLNRNGEFIYVSPVVEQLYGYVPGDLIGLHFLQFIHPDDREHAVRIFGQELSGTYPTDEFRVILKDGSIRWFTISPRPLLHEGRVTGFNYVLADITERKRAEVEERLTRERFETLVKIAEMQDAGEREVSEFVMQAACRMTGSTISFIGWITSDERELEIVYWSPSVMKDCSISSLPLRFQIQNAGIWADAVRERQPRIINDYSAAHPGKNGLPKGHVKISRFLSVPVIDNGKAVMIAVVANKPEPYDDADMTRLTLLMQGVWGHLQQRKAEQVLRESEEKFRLFFNNINDAVYVHEVHPDGGPGRLIEVNEVLCQRLGYSREELLNMSIMDILSENGRKKATGMLGVLKKDGQAIFETEHLCRDGTVVPVEVSTHRFTQGHRELSLANARDITERRKAEAAIKRSEALLNEMGKLAKIGGWELDLRTKGVLMTAETRHICEIPENSINDLEHALPFFDMPGRATLESALQRCSESGEPFDLELLFTTASGRHIWTRSIGRGIKNNNTIVKITGTLQDITERRQAEEALKQINRKLTLLSSITRHDIKNQLLALKGYLELSLSMLDDGAQLEQYITKEMKAANAIERQIAFTKEYESLGVNAPVWQNAGSCVRDAVPDLPVGSIAIREDLGTVEIYADPLLGKVFYNLIDNALRYGGPTMSAIRLSCKNSGAGITVVVEDDGAGISAEDKKRLFERGFGHNTGLGLFLSREILSITGITITETGEPGKGARFEIAVPEGGYRFGGETGLS